MVQARSRVQTGDGCSFIFQMRILYFVTRLASSGGVQAGSRQEVGALLSGPTISTPPNLPQLHQPGLLLSCLDWPHSTPLLGTIRTQTKDIEIYKKYLHVCISIIGQQSNPIVQILKMSTKFFSSAVPAGGLRAKTFVAHSIQSHPATCHIR